MWKIDHFHSAIFIVTFAVSPRSLSCPRLITSDKHPYDWQSSPCKGVDVGYKIWPAAHGGWPFDAIFSCFQMKAICSDDQPPTNIIQSWLTLSLPRVINFKFPLQHHQKYYITHSMKNLAFITHIYSDGRWVYYEFSPPHLIHFSFKGWENVQF